MMVATISLGVQGHELVVEPVHHIQDVLVPLEDDLRRRGGLENASARLHVGEHLHLLRVDLRVEDHPGSAAQLALLTD